ncbi:MAG: M28 family metallopeptidase [Thermotogota bacterium]
MKKIVLLVLSILIISFVFSNILDKDIIIQDLKETVFELSKKEFQGRLSGTVGSSKVEKYLYESLGKVGYTPKYFSFELDVAKYNKTPILIYGEKSFDYAYDFEIKIQPGVRYNGKLESEVYVLNKIEDLENIAKNKVIFVKKDLFERISQNPMNMQKLFNPNNKVEGLFIAGDTDFGEFPKMIGVFSNGGYTNQGPFLGSVTEDSFDYIKDNPDQKILIEAYATIEKSNTNNVYTYVENNAEETIIFGAHFDGQGYIPQTYPGAYDNASGASIVLELAKMLKDNKKFNYIFVFFSGEEQYYIGSQKFVQEKEFNIEKTYYVNFDSLGINNINTINIENIKEGNKSLRTKMFIKSKNYDFKTTMSEVVGGDAQAFNDVGITSVQLIQPSKGIMHTLNDKPELLSYEILYEVTKFVYDFFQTF